MMQHTFLQPSQAVLLHIRYVMESVCESMLFTDVTLVTETERLRAHRAILASHSTYLRGLMISNVGDAGAEEEPVLVVRDISSAHLRLMMQFFYTGEVSLASHDDLQPMKEACIVLGVSSLMARLDELSFSLHCLPTGYEHQQQDGYTVAPPEPSAGADHHIDPLNTTTDSTSMAAVAAKEETVVRPLASDQQMAFSSNVAKQSATDDFVDTSFADIADESHQSLGIANSTGPRPPPPLKQPQQLVKARPASPPQPPPPPPVTIKKKPFACGQCSSKFYTSDGLAAHERAHAGMKPFACPICQVGISTKDHLEVHLRIHTGVKPYACDTCGKAFADKTSFKRHSATAHVDARERPVTLKCKHCKKDYADASTLRRHQKEKHPGVYKTQSAGRAKGNSKAADSTYVKEEEEKEEAQAAVAAASEAKRFACGLCKKRFFRRAILNNHMARVHRIEKAGDREKYVVERRSDEENNRRKSSSSTSSSSSIQCPDCDMVFYKHSTMVIHRRTHTGDKPYVCELCGKKFARSNNLKLHKRTHTGDRPYVCEAPDCGRSFADVSAFRRHGRTHTGERPYSCGRCRRSFAQPSSAKTHEKNCKRPMAPHHPHHHPMDGGAKQRGGAGGPLTSATAAADGANMVTGGGGGYAGDNSLSVMAGSINADTLD